MSVVLNYPTVLFYLKINTRNQKSKTLSCWFIKIEVIGNKVSWCVAFNNLYEALLKYLLKYGENIYFY